MSKNLKKFFAVGSNGKKKVPTIDNNEMQWFRYVSVHVRVSQWQHIFFSMFSLFMKNKLSHLFIMLSFSPPNQLLLLYSEFRSSCLAFTLSQNPQTMFSLQYICINQKTKNVIGTSLKLKIKWKLLNNSATTMFSSMRLNVDFVCLECKWFYAKQTNIE